MKTDTAELIRRIASLEKQLASFKQNQPESMTLAEIRDRISALPIQSYLDWRNPSTKTIFSHFRLNSGIDDIDDLGMAWVNDVNFSTPTNIYTDAESYYMFSTTSGWGFFARTGLSGSAPRQLWAKFRIGSAHTCYLRVDDGSNNNYRQFGFSQAASGKVGCADIVASSREGGAAQNSVTVMADVPKDEMRSLRMYEYATKTMQPYLGPDDTTQINLTSFPDGNTFTWTPARAGIVLYNTNGNRVVVDWLLNTFD